MGIMDSVKKVGKKIVSGVKKAFKKVVEVVGKFLNSKIGKFIMIAATVVTAGMALYGAYAGMVSGMSSTAAQTGNFMSKFAAGAKGALAGAKTGMGAANKMMGNALTGKFGAAKDAFTGLKAGASSAGLQAAGGIAKQTISTPMEQMAANADSVAAGPAGGGEKFLAGGSTPVGPTPGATAAGPAPSGGLNLGNATGMSGADASYAEQFKGMLSEGMKGYQGAGGPAADSFLSKLTSSIASPEGLLAVGKMGAGAVKLFGAAQAEEDKRDEDKKLIKRGWTNDPNFDPGNMFGTQGPRYA